MHIFFTPDITDHHYTLSQEESKHCIKVLRLKKGDEIELIDGKGRKYIGVIQNNDSKKCLIKVKDSFHKDKRKNNKLVIAIAPTKNINRFETFLEKVTEIGIDQIIPLLSRYSERKIIKNERLEKIIISAVKQSKTFFKPKLEKLTSFEDLINKDFIGEKYIAHCYESDNKKHLKEFYIKGKDAILLIGPEGDFSEEEVKRATESGYIEVSLSESRLRTETAGIVACQIIDFINT